MNMGISVGIAVDYFVLLYFYSFFSVCPYKNIIGTNEQTIREDMI